MTRPFLSSAVALYMGLGTNLLVSFRGPFRLLMMPLLAGGCSDSSCDISGSCLYTFPFFYDHRLPICIAVYADLLTLYNIGPLVIATATAPSQQTHEWQVIRQCTRCEFHVVQKRYHSESWQVEFGNHARKRASSHPMSLSFPMCAIFSCIVGSITLLLPIHAHLIKLVKHW